MQTIKQVSELIKNTLSVRNKWHFISENVNGHKVEIKCYVGAKECDLQIFRINGLHANIGYNYANKTKTIAGIIEKIEKYCLL